MTAGADGRPDYAQACAAFDWGAALDDLGWSGTETVDLAWTAVGRHAAGARAERTAIHWAGADGSERRLTFRDVDRLSARFGNALKLLGVGPGDRVATLLPRIPETIPAMLGVWRAGAILVPVFGGFGADAAAYRLRHSGARAALVGARYRHLVPAADGLTTIEADDPDALDGASDACEPALYRRDDPAVIIYTSGSTGQPKGCTVAANIFAAMWPYVRYSLDLRPDDDVFWPTGDPSWGYGLCCYLPALAAGATVLSVEANATAAVCCDVIGRHKVSNLATTPTVLRSLMAEGEAVRPTGATVRVISSCGEPLNGEAVEFFRRAWNVTPMDHFGATEFGLPVGNHNAIAMAVKPGSMGLPAPGQRMAVVGDAGEELPDGTVGLIAQRCDDNSRYWLRYWNDEAASASLRRGDWTCTGDLARRDTDGYFRFEGRADDIIKTSGYRVGPFEIESAALRHEAVAEAAAVGVPDPARGQAIKLFVVTRAGFERTQRLADEIADTVRTAAGRHLAPREVVFSDSLPKTQTGKIQRFLLRQAAATNKE
jgi:acetyl-CoA synthetase